MNMIKKQKSQRLPEANPVNPVSKTKPLVSALLHWFATNARDLPWRRTRDPYAIWVSEIMLQQTQVKTVIPYWERWMQELPTIASLSAASTDKIHKLWEGLGYYTRVRNMQKAAQQIISTGSSRREEAHSKNRQSAIGNRQFKSVPPDVGCYKFPDTFDAVLALPGIGRYTAGAICSIAFNQPTPILDGNVIRVLTRIHGIGTDPREKQTNAHLWQLAEELVIHASRQSLRVRTKDEDDQSCSHLNQSLMELGALICTPRSPNCAVCPVQNICVARKDNLQEQLPNLGKREAATERRFLAFVVERDGKFLVRQRPAGVVNAHLWEFPNVEVGAAPGRARHSGRAAASQIRNGAQRTDAPYQQSDFHTISEKPLVVIKHSITRYRITLEAWHAELARHTPHRKSALPGVWRTLAECESLAFTSAHKKIRSKLMLTAD
jgi:A/G-specific adenine glycosylase